MHSLHNFHDADLYAEPKTAGVKHLERFLFLTSVVLKVAIETTLLD